MELVILLAAVFAIAGAFMAAIGRFATSPLARRHRTRLDRPSRIDEAAHLRSRVTNSVVSLALLFGVPLALRADLIAGASGGAVRTVAEAAAILLVYDLGYYLLHRFGFHAWSVGRRIHAVHHAVRSPYARDSLYIHPAETAAGLTLFLAATALVGPVGLWSFGLAFLVYSLLNVLIHSAVVLRFAPFRTLTALVHHHDVHHESMKSGYYGSITPLWDRVFGTAGSPPTDR